MNAIVVTIVGQDRPGIVEAIAQVVRDHQGNWLESRMAHLGGKFAGIVRVEIPADQEASLLASFEQLTEQGVRCLADLDSHVPLQSEYMPYLLDLVGNDRPGIVREISHVLAAHGVNVEELQTRCVPAPNSGGPIFQATANLRLPAGVSPDTVRTALEKVAHDLMVDIALRDGQE
ncbi:MAG: ACT domain-containing protein [Pirellulaceae bacterium]|nr:hypothetical protein [Planctomycetales bacterium]